MSSPNEAVFSMEKDVENIENEEIDEEVCQLFTD